MNWLLTYVIIFVFAVIARLIIALFSFYKDTFFESCKKYNSNSVIFLYCVIKYTPATTYIQ